MFDPQQQKSFRDALALHQQGKFDAAAPIYERLLAAHPDHADLLQLLGALHHQGGRSAAAVDFMQRSLAIVPDQPVVLVNLGGALLVLKRAAEALQACERAITLKPDYAEAHYSRGVILLAMGRADEAVASFDQALRLAPRMAEACLNRGSALKALRRYDEAIASYRQAIALKPAYPEAFNNSGNVFDEQNRLEQAEDSYRRAVTLNPAYGEAWNNLGGVLRRRRRYQEALEAYGQALRFAPNLESLAGMYVHTKQHVCDWTNIDADIQDLLSRIARGTTVTNPFVLLAIPANAALQRTCATAYARQIYPKAPQPAWNGERYGHAKIRVAYFSADFHSHATAHLMAEMLERHDRARFEVTGVSWGPSDRSDMRARLERAFDVFVDAQTLSDGDVAAEARAREIDIAVDLKGFTHGGRAGIFARRVAPVQVGFLGYPGTMGMDDMDYLVADPVLIPDALRPHYSENIVYLPDSYQVNDRRRPIAPTCGPRAAFGLPETGVVFCSFNNNYKIMPPVFDIWMCLLRTVPGSVLWLFDSNPAAKENLRREAAARGVDGDRLVFAPHLPLPEHLARHRHADLYLDTFHCNGHTTTSDALWAGVPAITWPSDTFAGRVSASLLNAVGLPDLVADTWEAYEALALDLATDADKRAAVRARLAANRLTCPLFDTDRFTRHLEAAYARMHECAEAGLPPADIRIPA